MITVDNLLLKIVNTDAPPIDEMVPARDSKILKSLASSILGNYFITENQGRLLIKILRENSKKITNFEEIISETISSPQWSRSFRQIEQVKKFYISKNAEQEPVLYIELTYSHEIRKILQNLGSKVEALVPLVNGKSFTADLTEKNIVVLVDLLTPLGFEVDETIKNHYQTIKSWSETTIRNQFLLTSIEHINFHKAITADLGIATPIDQNIINDRSVRYRYTTENPQNFGENLTEIIANRGKNKIWINKSEHNLTDLVSSLKSLRRMPMLVVFENSDDSALYKNLEILTESLENNGIYDNVGIYFRLPNNDHGKKFNTLIANKSYNAKLDSTTQVAAVQSGKIPKFFLSNPWKPMSVIALDTRMGLRHGKTSVYSNCCDLIVEYAEQPSLLEERKIEWR